MPLAKFAPFRAAEMNAAWLRNERFWPCPPVPVDEFNSLAVAARNDALYRWIGRALEEACTCTQLLREGDILEPCPVHGWVTH